MTATQTYRLERENDFVTECVMQVLKEEYLPEYRHYNGERLDEGLASLASVAKNWPKIKNAVNLVIQNLKKTDNIGKIKEIIGKINAIKSYNPGTIAKWLLKENSKQAVNVRLVTAQQKEMARVKGIVGEYACDVAGYYWDAAFTATFNELKATIGLLYTSVKTVIGFFGPIGQLISSAFDAAESITVDLLSGLRDWITITYNALNKVLKGLVGFDLNDIANAFNSIKDVGEYGGTTGKAWKSALACVKKARKQLLPLSGTDLRNRATWISCVYRNKKAWTEKELSTTLYFCNNLRNLEIPTYDQAMKKWPGINRAKDDGTYAKCVLSALGYTLIGDDGNLVNWFKKSCDVAAMTHQQLLAAYKNIK